MKFLKLFDDYLEETVVVILFLMILVVGTEQVITRYLMRFVFSWAEELMRICFVILALFSFSLCAKKLEHVKVEALLTVLPKRLGAFIKIFSSTVFLAFTILLIQHSWNIMSLQYRSHQVTAAMGIPTCTYFVFGPVCFTMMAFRIIQKSIIPQIKEFFSFGDKKGGDR